MCLADGVDRRQIQDVESHLRNLVEPAFGFAKRAAACRIDRARAGKHFIPGAVACRDRIDDDPQRLCRRGAAPVLPPLEQFGALDQVLRDVIAGVGLLARRALPRLVAIDPCLDGVLVDPELADDERRRPGVVGQRRQRRFEPLAIRGASTVGAA
jgi:hypothetical protein